MAVLDIQGGGGKTNFEWLWIGGEGVQNFDLDQTKQILLGNICVFVTKGKV